MVNLDLYRVFYTVAKCGSLTKAAEELYISQPAVSQSIKQLESQLGISLFNRTHRGMELSAQGGKMIFSKVEQALGLLKEAETLVKQINLGAAGAIRIGASESIFEYFLAEKIVRFHERFPAVKIELLSDVTPRTVEELKAHRCDVAFVNLPMEVEPELKLYGNCMRISDTFVAGEKYAELAQGTVPLAKLKEYPLITLDKNTIARRSLNSFLASLGLEFTPAVEVGSWDMMKRLAANGMGIGVMPREYAKRRLEEGSLFEVKTDPVLPVRSVGVLVPRNRAASYALRAFLEQFGVHV